MAICDVAGNVKRRTEAGDGESNYKEAGKADFVKVFGVKKEVRNSKIFPEVSGDHCKKNDPAENQDMVTLYIIKE
jgi:hypothetical protein